MAKNKKQDRRRAQEQSRTAEEQTQQREARNDTAERTPSPADVARKGRERRFGHN
ncbi:MULTISPECIES: hypothetical protein [Streptomyces]|uniref:hypothetical protein n=1 Tax=Streptomyces TaxID=1883 RepID=UPI0018FE4CD2|nr:hypothetical protein [Streptomyces sp. NRRL S-1868]